MRGGARVGGMRAPVRVVRPKVRVRVLPRRSAHQDDVRDVLGRMALHVRLGARFVVSLFLFMSLFLFPIRGNWTDVLFCLQFTNRGRVSRGRVRS